MDNFKLNLSLPVDELKQDGTLDAFSKYRIFYKEYASLLGFDQTQETYSLDSLYENFLKVTGEKLGKLINMHKAETIVCGLSGDLDSSFNFLAMGEIIKARNLQCKIIAYHFKNNFQPDRAKRIEKIVKHVNANYVAVEFFSYDIAVSSKLLAQEITIFERSKIRPRSLENIEAFNAFLEDAQSFSDISKEKTTHQFSRENGPLMHEVSTAVRGRLLRKYPKSILIGTQNSTELCVSNFTTSDLLITFAPLAFVPKKIISEMFVWLVKNRHSEVKLKDWQYTLSHLTPFFPSGISYTFEGKNLIISRNGTHYDYFNKVVLNLEEFTNTKDHDFWQFFTKSIDSFPVPGMTQYIGHDFIHLFLIDGFSEEKVDLLIQRFKEQKALIFLVSVIYLSAREMTIKDTYMIRMLS